MPIPTQATTTSGRRLAACFAAALRTRACCAPFAATPRRETMQPSRRDFLKGLGALVVSFQALGGDPLCAQDSMGTRPSHIDPAELDSWLAISADGSVTAF